MGDAARDCAQALTEAGVDAVGANCGSLDPSQVATVIAEMKEATGLPLVAQPNAGLPKMVDGRAVFDMSPADFAVGVRECLQAGARLLGGCCGTSPAHIRAMIDLLEAE
jgi:methionine synthase I (cobalamin-dependent)